MPPPKLILKDNCTNCKFSFQPEGDGEKMVCRRFPPVMGLDFVQQMWITKFTIINFPTVTWCGEYKQNIVLSS